MGSNLEFLFRLPFNRSKPIGYTIDASIEVFSFVITGHTAVCALFMVAGFYEIIISLAQSIQSKLHDLTKNYEIHKINLKLRNDLRNAFQFYIEVKG